jgi:hypothetical protein
MAAITSATTTTSLVETVPAEQIAGVLGAVARAVPIADAAAFPFGVSGSNIVRIVQLSDAAFATSESSGKTETDEFAAVEQLAVESTVTAVTVGIRKAVSDEIEMHGVFGGVAIAAMDSILAGLEQLDQDVLSRITSAGNASNFSGLDYTIERRGVALAALRLRNGPGQIREVLHETAYADLLKSMRAAGLAYGIAMGAQIAGQLNAQLKGFMPPFEGVPLLVSTDVPQFDANNWSSALVRVGGAPADSGLAYAIWKPMVTERDRVITRLYTEIVTSSRYGSTLVRDDCIQEVITSKT